MATVEPNNGTHAGNRAVPRRTDDDVRVREGRYDLGVAEARERFGGIDVAGSLAGMLVALALLVILGGLAAAAIGAFGYQLGNTADGEEISIAGLVAGLTVLFVSFLIGGWAAGRMARYNGGVNGLMTAVWTLVIAAILAGIGAWLGNEYDVFSNVNLPQWFSRDEWNTGAIVSGGGALLVMLLGRYLGGKWGERLHRRADAVIAATREGGIVREREIARDTHVRRETHTVGSTDDADRDPSLRDHR